VRAFAQAGALASVVLTAHTALNLRGITRLRNEPGTTIRERISILIPARNEAHRIGSVIEAVLAQQGLAELEVIVLDDGSSDDTAGVVREALGSDPRATLISGADDLPPEGWLGKSWACHRLSRQATGSILVFIDADVVLAPWAVHAAVTELRGSMLQLVSPYPRQLADTMAERVTQPLVNWSWMTTLPVSLARSGNPALCAAIGQFLVVDAQAYTDSGGHESVREHVVEDVEVLRSLKRAGYRGMPLIGSEIAECRMYDGAHQVFEGYTKSLWSVFGSLPGALGGISAMALIYVVPPLVMVSSRDSQARRWGAVGYAAGVAGRAMAARSTGERVIPDALAQPISIGAFAGMTVASLVRNYRGTNSWKGRAIHIAKPRR
jgi:hypothetical protein